jgi:tetratricopeptide (TPR) repeat protein
MKTIPELLKLYEIFFQALSKKLNKNPKDPLVRGEAFKAPTHKEIEGLEKKFEMKVPEEIKLFWKNLKNSYEASRHDDEDWVAGRDFIKLKYIERDTQDLRDLAKKLDDNDPAKKLHETGIQLTFSEPILLFDPKSGAIHQLLWDGEPVVDPIAPSMSIFLEHWLAAGCFYEGDFDTYYNHVKDIVPIKIFVKDNLWLKYKKKYDEPKQFSDPKAMEHLERLEKAYDEGNAAIQVWRSGKEEEAAKMLKKVIEVAKEEGDPTLLAATLSNYAGLCEESGRPEEGLKMLQDFVKNNPENANTNPKILCSLGQYLYESGKFNDGLECCNKALNVDAKYALGYYTRACAHIRLKNNKEAIADIVKAVEYDPGLRGGIAEDKDFAPLRDMPAFIKAINAN